jgi:hypothetical protein
MKNGPELRSLSLSLGVQMPSHHMAQYALPGMPQRNFSIRRLPAFAIRGHGYPPCLHGVFALPTAALLLPHGHAGLWGTHASVSSPRELPDSPLETSRSAPV